MQFFRKILSCFLRDFAIESSYRSAFILQLAATFFEVAALYYLSHFVDSPQLDRSLPAGHSYFAFVLVGVAFFDYMGVSMNLFDASLEQARRNGTLESILVTDTSLPVVLTGAAAYPFVLMSLRTLVYLAWGAILFGFPAGGANWIGAAVVLAVSVLAFTGLGILSSSYLLLFKRGNPAKWLLLGVSGVLGGLMYPVSILPGWLQKLAAIIPVTYSLQGLRAALLTGADFRALLPNILALSIFAVILLPVSFIVFGWALRRTKISGTLTHF
jgi:ABC-2 type transport system permease protein